MSKDCTTCITCNKVLSTKTALITHQLVHFRELKKLKEFKIKKSTAYQCADCGRVYGSEASLIRHRSLHDGTLKKKSCEYCDKEFNFDTALRLHISNYHTKEKPFACHYCDKTFGISGNLKNHLRIHTGQMHACNSCDSEFKSSTQLARHISDTHLAELETFIMDQTEPKPKRGRKSGRGKAKGTSKHEDSKVPLDFTVTPRKPRKSEDLRLTESSEVIQEIPRSTRTRRPPLRYAQTQFPTATRKARRNNQLPRVDYLQPVPDGMDELREPFDSIGIELDVSQVTAEDDGAYGNIQEDYDQLSPIILNSYSLAENDDNDDGISLSSSYANSVDSAPVFPKSKFICKYSTGLILEGVQFPRI